MLALYECHKSGYPTDLLLHLGLHVHFKYYGYFYYDMFYPPLLPNVHLPPNYDLSKVELNITIHRAAGDAGSNNADINLLKEKIPGKIKCDHIIKDINFAHQDFPCGKTSKELVFDPVIDFWEKGICPNPN